MTTGAILAAIHRSAFHLCIECFLQPWAESAYANAVHYLSFSGIMTHHPLFLLAPSKVIPSPASHSLIRIQRPQENLSHLLSQVPLKRSVTAPEHFIICRTWPPCVATQERRESDARKLSAFLNDSFISGDDTADVLLLCLEQKHQLSVFWVSLFLVFDLPEGGNLLLKLKMAVWVMKRFSIQKPAYCSNLSLHSPPALIQLAPSYRHLAKLPCHLPASKTSFWSHGDPFWREVIQTMCVSVWLVSLPNHTMGSSPCLLCFPP